MMVCLNGKFLPAAQAKVSVFDHGFLYGDGVYETLRTYRGEIWQLEKHLERLQKSAEALQIILPSLKKIGGWVLKTIEKNRFKESRIRITVTRGINHFDFGRSTKPTILVQVFKLIPEPKSVYERGVKVISFPTERFLAQAKTISLLPMIMAQQAMARAKAYEAIFVASETGTLLDGNAETVAEKMVREGSKTNVYIVHNGVIMTPKSHVLPGTMREFLLHFLRKRGHEILVQDFPLARLYAADEVFITNAPRGIVPVVEVDKKKIGTGKPGKMTKEIMNAFALYTGQR